MPDFTPGLCGRYTSDNRKCKIAHVGGSSGLRYANHVGTYPSQCLPSTRTIWRSVWNTSVPFGESMADPGSGAMPGGSPFGEMIVGMLIISNIVPPKRWDSWHNIIFAATANRLNVAHIVTEDEIKAADDWQKTHPDERRVDIDVGEYVFEAIAVCDTKDAMLYKGTENELTAEDLAEIAQTGESAADKAFRNLFSIPLPGWATNRFVEIALNKYGLEYRFDNDSEKSKSAWRASSGGLQNASIRDGSCRKMTVDFKPNYKVYSTNPSDPPGTVKEERAIKAGDILWLSYVGVKKHFIRQKVVVTWFFIEQFPEAYCYPLRVQVANYRFYEWQMEPDPRDNRSLLLGGWRITDCCNVMPNHVALHGFFFESPQLGDIGIGYAAGRGAVEQSYYPGELTLPRLDKIMSGQEKAPTFTYENNTSMESPDGTVNFHLNMGKRGEDKNAYMKSDWYRSRSWTSYFGEYATLDHVFFNVHPLANKKRDIDKWGVEKTLAQALQSAISQGKATYFPFMDDPTPEGDKSVVLGAPQYLGASNCIFAPVVPPTTYTIGNAEADVGNIGTFGYWGGTPTFGGPATPQGGGSSGLTNYHAFESNLITDRFEKDTHILVELNFSKYQDGPIILTIECAGEDVGAVSCIADPLHSDAFTVHNNQDSFLVYNQFSQMYTGLTTATFRPELPPNSRKVDNPKPGDYAPELGYTSNLADEPGLQPGRVISLYSLTDKDAITWYYYNIPTDQPPLQDYENDNKTKLTFTEDASIGMVTIPIDSLDVWHTRLQMNFTVTDATKLDESSDEILALFKAGDSVEGAIDRSRIDRTSGYPSISLWVQHLKGSTIVVTGESLKYLKVNSILIQSVKQAKADNYLLNIERDTSGETLGNRPAVTQPIFFKTSIATIGEDSKSNLFVFMTDSNDGISAVSSPNYGVSWLFYYGVVEPIGGNKIEDPFVLNDHTNNLGYLFFRMQNKIFCKIIPYEMFLGDDAQLVESSDKDVFVYDTQTGKVIEEKDSVYSDNGIMLRRRMPAFIAAGNTATGDTRYLLGIADQSGNVADEHFETRKVGTGGTIIVPKNIAALSPTTLIGNYDIDTRFFSATRHLSNLASLRLWFLQQIKDEKGADGSGGGGSLLQCHLSNDDGKTWIDQWESIHYGLTRAKSDETKNLMFIDTAGGATDAPDSGRVAQFGVNLHWSALREHKVSDTEWQEKKEEAESHALEVKSPYAFYHSESKMIFMFYIYEGCLLCRRIDEQLFADCVRATDTPDEGNGMNKLKDIVERRTKADFVDGYLNKTSLLAELGYTGTDQEILDSLKQSLKDNKKDDQQLFNIRFGFHENVKNFGTERTINPQRVCAYESSQGYVRVFYKFNDDFIRSAIWNGSFWMAEDFLKQIGATE